MESYFRHGSLHLVLFSSMARLELGGKVIDGGFDENGDGGN